MTSHPAALFALLGLAAAATGSDCNRTSVGFTPINDLGAGLYLGQYPGGLYPGGSNQIPGLHNQAGLNFAGAVRPLNVLGNPDPSGKVVLLSVGMSNTTQEWCSMNSTIPCEPWTFTGQALADARVNHSTLAIADGAYGGHAAPDWVSPNLPDYDRVRDTILMPQGLSEAQVQVAWVKQADAAPGVSLPNPGADAFTLETELGQIARAMRVRYPNLKLVFLSSRIYAGYATSGLNPEPYAYESGFSVKWLIQAQINQMNGGGIDPRAGDLSYNGAAPWLGWAAYLWADGLTPRSDGLTWACSDVRTDDGTHPSQAGQQKVGSLLMDFFLRSPQTAPWFLAAAPCYANCDGSTAAPVLNVNDFQCFMNRFAQRDPYANCDGSTTPPVFNVNDFQCFLNKFAQGCP